MLYPDFAVFLDRDEWYWCSLSENGSAPDKSLKGYPTKAEAWRAVVRHLIALLNKKR